MEVLEDSVATGEISGIGNDEAEKGLRKLVRRKTAEEQVQSNHTTVTELEEPDISSGRGTSLHHVHTLLEFIV